MSLSHSRTLEELMSDEIDWRKRGTVATSLLSDAGFDEDTLLEKLRSALEEVEVHRGNVMRGAFDARVAESIALATSGAGKVGPQVAMWEAIRAARLLAWEEDVSSESAVKGEEEKP